MKSYLLGAALAATMPATAFAQSAASATVVTPVVVPSAPSQNVTIIQQQAAANVLRAGAPVPVALSEFLTTKGKLKVGQRVQLEVAQDVLLNGRVVIPARSPVEGVITEVRNKGMWGKSGGIHLQIKSVNINGTNIRLKGDMDSQAKQEQRVL